MKASIKATVAELLPVLVARPMEADLAAAERLVDSEGLIIYHIFFLATFSLHYELSESRAIIIHSFFYYSAGGPSLASKLRNLSSESFVQLLAAIFKVVQVRGPAP